LQIAFCYNVLFIVTYSLLIFLTTRNTKSNKKRMGNAISQGYAEKRSAAKNIAGTSNIAINHVILENMPYF